MIKGIIVQPATPVGKLTFYLSVKDLEAHIEHMPQNYSTKRWDIPQPASGNLWMRLFLRAVNSPALATNPTVPSVGLSGERKLHSRDIRAGSWQSGCPALKSSRQGSIMASTL